MTAHVYSLVSALMLTILLSRVSTQYQGDQQYYDMDEGDLGEEEEAIIDVSHPEYLETEDEDYPQYVSHLGYILVWSMHTLLLGWFGVELGCVNMNCENEPNCSKNWVLIFGNMFSEP